MEIILINGKKRSGKDFVAKKLREKLESGGKVVRVLSFADPIKEIMCKTFNISLAELDDLKNNDINILINGNEISFRQILQNFGTEAMQSVFSKHIWVNKLTQRAYEKDCDYLIVPDFRFVHEDISPIKVKVINNSVKSEDQHKSENDLNNYKFIHIIDNTGYKDITNQIEDLTYKVLNVGTDEEFMTV